MLAIFSRNASKHRGQDSDRHATRNATGDLQQVGLHVDDLVFSMPFAGEEVLQAVGLEADGAVDEAVLVGTGVVPERVVCLPDVVRRLRRRAATRPESLAKTNC